MMKRSNCLGTLGSRGLARIGVALVFVLLAVIGTVPGLASAVDFSDPGLEAAVRAAIGKPTGDIQESDLIELTSLDARYQSISNLEGIQYLVNLRELDLYGNEIVDIAPLSGLENLTTLILSRNEIADIGPLSPLTHLQNLQLRNNQIRDIQPLLDNPALADNAAISLSFNPLPLQPGSPGLRDIDALRDRGTNVRFEPIIDFLDPGVESAIREAIGKETDDILERDLLGLTALTARYQGISSLEGLELCVNLTELDLYGNELVDIRELSGLIKLTKLSLEDNEIVDLGPLANLTNLTHLYLDNNQISDLSPLANLTKLTTLYLWENKIVDLAPLSGLANLTGLYLYFNQIVDISPLSDLTQLTGLGLSWNQIVDINALSGLINLTRLYLDNNKIAVLAPLVGNAGIDRDDVVHLQGNPFPIEPGSPNRHDIDILQSRGVKVTYTPEE